MLMTTTTTRDDGGCGNCGVAVTAPSLRWAAVAEGEDDDEEAAAEGLKIKILAHGGDGGGFDGRQWHGGVADGKASNTNDDDVAKMDEIVPQPQPPQISRTLHPLDNEAKPKGSAIRWRRGHHDNGADKNRSKSILSSLRV
ncbi:hypothetical protein OsJ_33631 [Oryza sativa Japonica Group]|uniref:Uncharacterized protein n=1 Tax=Oryza sativa subsp. japonica TaxID=39947 RepID=B9GAB0_ORYSJ|nr:hypothetical protein OsJ_33631 [Oryza sativa Japonica Group]